MSSKKSAIIETKRIDYLDSVRGLAALSVVASHFILSYSLPQSVAFTNNSILHVFWNGKSAVSLFFILSGFVLSLKYFQTDTPPPVNVLSFSKYLIARLFRLYPLFLAILVLSTVVKILFFKSYVTVPPQLWTSNMWQEPVTAIKLLKEAILVVRIPPEGRLRLIPQDWSLSIEVLLSFFVPFLVAAYKRRFMYFFILAAILLNLVSYHTFDFFLGIIVARNFETIKSKGTEFSRVFKVFVLILGIVFYTNRYLLDTEHLALPAHSIKILDMMFFHSKYIISLGCLFILVSAINSRSLQRILNSRPLIFIGRISYSVYVLHMLFLISFVPYLLNVLNRMGLADEYFTRLTAMLALYAILIPASYIFYHLVELPSIRLGRFLGNRFISVFSGLAGRVSNA